MCRLGTAKSILADSGLHQVSARCRREESRNLVVYKDPCSYDFHVLWNTVGIKYERYERYADPHLEG